MIVTHLLQLLSFVAMEPPASLSGAHLRLEKQKVFDAIKPIQPDDVVRGQYEGYREIEGVADDSDTETFVAVKVEIDNWRWAGVPFFLRTGKCLARVRGTWSRSTSASRRCSMFPGEVQHQGANQLVFEFSEPGSITADFQAKVPGPTMELGPARMTFRYEESFCRREPARGLRAADPRRDDRRRDPVHAGRRDRAALGGERSGARRSRTR